MSHRWIKELDFPRELPWWKRMRDALEAPLARAGLWLVPRLPRWAVLGLAQAAGTLGYWFSRRDRDVALANLDVAFGDGMPEAEKRRVARASMANFARTALDLLWFGHPGKGRERLEKWVDVGEREAAWMHDPGPWVAVTGHLGNWELIGRAWAAWGGGLASVAMPLKNARVEEMLRKERQNTGQVMVERDGAFRKLVKRLREGGNVGLLLDQNTAPWEGGVYRDFFGLTASMSPVAGSLCRLGKAGLVFGYALPERGGRYRVTLSHRATAAELAAEGGEDDLPERVNARVAAWYEEVIREHPETWLWSYKRWRYIPLGMDPTPFPYYALPPETDPELPDEWKRFLKAKRRRKKC